MNLSKKEAIEKLREMKEGKYLYPADEWVEVIVEVLENYEKRLRWLEQFHESITEGFKS